jgi:dTDP-4-dehydrorhamnose reductase
VNDFEKRFRQFISGRTGCKILDDGAAVLNGEIADFLLDDGRIIAELKCLDEDMIEKLQQLATEIIEGRNLPIYGKFPFSDLIESQPDRSDLKKQAVLKIAGPLGRHFKKANSQIKNIKRQLRLEESQGLLIVTNTHNASLEPQAALWFLSVLLHSRKQDGSPICSSIDCILYLTQVHRLGELDGVKLQPAVTMLREEHPKYRRLYQYVQEFLEHWAKFNGLPIFFIEKPFHEITDFSRTPMRRGGLLKDLNERPKGWCLHEREQVPSDKLLITGASGVIGKVLITALADTFNIFGVDRDVTSPSNRLFKAELSEYEQVAHLIRNISPLQLIVHLAADSRGSAPWESVFKNNIIVTKNVYEAAREASVRRVVFASSNHVTGGYEGVPPTLHKQLAPTMIKIADPIRPDSDYGVSKAFGEAVARQYYELYGIESICLRIGTVLADDNPTKDDRYLKTWLSHRDLVQLVKKCLLSNNVTFGIYYGVSNNRGRFWDISNAKEELGFWPEDDASTSR